MITLCIPTLKRKDCLLKCLASAEAGTTKPDLYFIIDNGGIIPIRDPELPPVNINIYSPSANIGLAASWNFFIRHTSEIRIICNDDIEFYPDTIEVLAKTFDENNISSPILNEGQRFSCFVISDKIFNTIGEFDENISPGYAYYEDNDYARRIQLDGRFGFILVPCGYDHVGSATLKAYDGTEMTLHHKRFVIAQTNYIAKWGGLPRQELFLTPYNQ